MANNTNSSTAAFRQEHDTMGVVNVPINALYTAQTQRAVDNFPFGHPFTPRLITSMAQLKKACATANNELGLLDADMMHAIHGAVDTIVNDYENYRDQFPISIFQTGSGTSTNMNLNEVIATLATRKLEKKVHPNDHVNMSQSSNDVMPTSISIAAYVEASESLLPAMEHLVAVINAKAKTVERVVITGRTHLMDAMPVTLAQELGGWSSQISKNIARVKSALERVRLLAIGGTAVGTGINAHPQFGSKVCTILSSQLHAPFEQNENLFEALSAPDSIVELSAQLKVLAVSLMKISNDLRWMNSGPIAGLGEIVLPALQPGSSIMPGKINPVIPESVTMVCAQVMGNDITATIAGQSGSFQLNVMLPVLANSVLQSLFLLSHACRLLADKAISGFAVNEERISELVGKNPILVTALNPIVGYEMGAKIAKTAYKEGRSVKDVAMEFTDLSASELDKHLDPLKLTSGGIADNGSFKLRALGNDNGKKAQQITTANMGKSDGASSAHAGGASSKPKSSSSSASALAKANGSSTFSSSSGSNSGGAGGGNSAMIGSEAALKLKNLKGIHEDDGDNDESDDAELLPMDAQLMKFILESMGAEKHDPRVVNQLQEFVHRYVTEILLDAQEYSLYAEKQFTDNGMEMCAQTLDADDIRLAIASRLNHHYAQLPSRELTMELAEKRNSIPLPPISNEYGVRLPPLQYQLVTQESDHQDPKLTNASRDDIFTESEGLAMDDGAMMARPPLHPGEGSRNKRVARNQIPIHFNQR